MSSANQQNNSFLSTVTSLALLGGIAASFAWACVSSSDNKGTGGAGSTTGGSTSTDTNVGGAAGTATNAGGHASAGGAGGSTNLAAGCPAASATESGTMFLPTTGATFNDFTDCAGYGTLSPGTIQDGLYVYMNQSQVDAGTTYLTTTCDATAHAVTIAGSTDATNYYGFGFWINGNPGADAATPAAFGLNASAYGGITFTIAGTAAEGAGPSKQFTMGLKSLVNGKVMGIQKVIPVTTTTPTTVSLKWSDFQAVAGCGALSDFDPGKILYFWAAFDHTPSYAINITIGTVSFLPKT
jgi:hypothetical protein